MLYSPPKVSHARLRNWTIYRIRGIVATACECWFTRAERNAILEACDSALKRLGTESVAERQVRTYLQITEGLNGKQESNTRT